MLSTFSKQFPQHPHFGLQRRDPLFEIRAWSGRFRDEPTNPVRRLSPTAFLQLTVGTAHSHHRDIVTVSENAGRRKLISRPELTRADLSLQVIEDSKVWLSFRHGHTVHERDV